MALCWLSTGASDLACWTSLAPTAVGAPHRPVPVVPGIPALHGGVSFGLRDRRYGAQAVARFAVKAAAGEGGPEGGVAAATQDQGQEVPAAGGSPAYRHILLPVLDRNPFLNDATRQAAAVATALAKQHGSDLTVVVIDEDEKEDSANHKQRLDSIRFHLSEGGFEEFKLLEKLGEGKMPAALVGEVADDLSLDLVVLPMEAIHHKHIDANLLAEFVPCPVLLLPL